MLDQQPKAHRISRLADKLEPLKGSKHGNTAPLVTIYRATADARGFFESILGFEGENLEGRWFRLSAETQRRYFGNVPFGRKAIKVSPEGIVSIFKSQAYGHDYDIASYKFNYSTKLWENVHPDGTPSDGTRPTANPGNF